MPDGLSDRGSKAGFRELGWEDGRDLREEVAVVGAKWREDSKSTPEVECSADRKKAVKRASNEGQMSVGHNVGLLPKAGRTTSHGHPLGPSVIAEVGSEVRVGPSVD